MRVYRDHNHTALSEGCAVAIGNFDGVHRGHEALLDTARSFTESGDSGHGSKLDLAVISFEPLPRAWFDPSTAPARLAGPAQKLRLLAAQGVDLTWLLRFNADLAGLAPEAFVTQILVSGLNARAVVIGEDFRFGKARKGDLSLMQQLGEQHGFTVLHVGEVKEASERISSTVLREAVAAGDFKAAEAMLGRPYTVSGKVTRGKQLGRTLGYPTANLRPWKGSTPLHGVYAVQARVCTDGATDWHDGVASVGVRPAVGGGEPLIEVHLFDFDADLYGQRLETRFLAKLRGEEDFASLDALVAQMNQDAAEARKLLAAQAVTE